MKYDTRDEAVMRLRGTVVMYSGRAVVVENVRESSVSPSGMVIEFTYLRNGNEGRDCLHSNRFSFKALRLGYVNIDGKATYLKTSPKKQYKQGYAGRNYKALSDMVLRRYPSFNEVLIMTKYMKSVAFNIDWAVEGRKLFYKGEVVGFLKGSKPLLFNEYSFLRSLLNEAVQC
jgi:hypothetical protein